jgi:hypothetical protein
VAPFRSKNFTKKAVRIEAQMFSKCTILESENLKNEAEMFIFGSEKVELNIPADQKLD